MKPMTKEEWDARQSVIRKVVDPETGRTRWGALAPDCTLRRRDGGCCCSKQADDQGKSPLLMRLLRPLLPIGWSRQLQGLEGP